jgi:putative thioredoxin
MSTDHATPSVFDVGEADFEAEVLRRSFQVPVVIDFWADWCGPCRTLGPMLEAAVAARHGEVVLARVDVDANPRLAMAFQVQSIPAVKAIAQGQLVAEFVGAQPARVVEQFLDALLPTQAERAASEAAQLDPVHAAARWRQVLVDDPDNVVARVGLAGQALERKDPDEALELLRPVEHAPEAQPALARARLLVEASTPGSEFAGAAAAAADGLPEAALEDLLAAVRERGGEQRDHARRLMLDVFRVLGDDHPLTARYRRDLSSALF